MLFSMFVKGSQSFLGGGPLCLCRPTPLQALHVRKVPARFPDLIDGCQVFALEPIALLAEHTQ